MVRTVKCHGLTLGKSMTHHPALGFVGGTGYLLLLLWEEARVLVQARFLTSKGWPFTQTPALTRCNLIFCKYLNISLSFFELDS